MGELLQLALAAIVGALGRGVFEKHHIPAHWRGASRDQIRMLEHMGKHSVITILSEEPGKISLFVTADPNPTAHISIRGVDHLGYAIDKAFIKWTEEHGVPSDFPQPVAVKIE